MHKLSHVEAQRVIGVLGETLEKLTCLGNVPQRPNSQLFRELEAARSYPVLNCLESQYQLEEAMAVERERNPHVDPNSLLEKKLKVNTRTLCRILREDIQALNVLFKFETEDDEDDEEEPFESKLVDTFEEKEDATNYEERHRRVHLRVVDLHESISDLKDVVYKALTTTVEDENSQKIMFQTVSGREKEAEEDRKTLEHQLAIARRNKDRMFAELDSKLAKLQAELKEVKLAAQNEESALNAHIKSENERINKDHKTTMEKLLAEESKLLEDLEKMAAEMEQAELQMQKKKSKYEGEVNVLVDKYDSDMMQKQAEVDHLRKQYDREKQRLEELEEHFRKVDLEEERISREDAEWAAFLAERHNEERIYDDGASAVQKLYRGFVARREFEVMKKKSKKGKKGKK